MPKKSAKTDEVKKQKPEPHPFARLIGQLVCYYDEGWRYGYLDEIESNKIAWIKPIVSKHVKNVRRTKVPIGDLKEVNATTT